jgi:hypothetical protein
MRIILGLALLALAGYLIWHGFDHAEAARAQLEAGASGTGQADEALQRLYPYSEAAIDARELALQRQIAARESSPATRPGNEELGRELKNVVLEEIPDRTRRGVTTEEPYVHPDAAAIIGLVGLLLALFMPRTRFRGLAFLGLLLGGLATAVAMLPADTQVGLIGQFSPLKSVISSFPRVAQACLALAGITLVAYVRAPARTSS